MAHQGGENQGAQVGAVEEEQPVRRTGALINSWAIGALGCEDDFVKPGYLADFVEASSTHPGSIGRVFAPNAGAAGAGSQATDLTFRARAVGGNRMSIVAPAPMGGLMPVALAQTHTCVLDADPDRHLGTIDLMPTVEPFFGDMLDLQMRRFRDATSQFYRTTNADDFTSRVYPVLVGKRARGDLRTPFMKLWLYAFASAIREDCMPNALFGLVGGVAAPQVEVAPAAGAAAGPVFDLGANGGQLDALICERSFNNTDLQFWVDAVSAFPRYTLTEAGSTPRPFACSIPGGQVFWHSPLGPPGGWVWAERNALPTYREYVQWMMKVAQRLDAQEEVVAAYQLAIDHGLGYLVTERMGRDCRAPRHAEYVALVDAVGVAGADLAVEEAAFAAEQMADRAAWEAANPTAAERRDNPYRALLPPAAVMGARLALQRAQAAVAGYDAGARQLYVSASMQFRNCPLPAPGYQRLVMAPLMAPVMQSASVQKLARADRCAAMRAAVRVSNAINYGYGHALAEFALRGRGLVSDRGTNPVVRESLWHGQVGNTPRSVPPIAAMASRIMRDCLGLGIVASNARYTCVGVDDYALTPGPWHDTVFGKWVPMIVRTPQIIKYAVRLPNTCTLPVQGMPIDPGLGGGGGYAREVAWATQRPVMVTLDQLAFLFDDEQEVNARMRSFCSYAVSADARGGAAWAASISKSARNAYTRRQVDKAAQLVFEPAGGDMFVREGTVVAYSHKRASAWDWVLTPVAGAGFYRGTDSLPEAYVIPPGHVEPASRGVAATAAPLLARLGQRPAKAGAGGAPPPPPPPPAARADARHPAAVLQAPAQPRAPAPPPPAGPAYIQPPGLPAAVAVGAQGVVGPHAAAQVDPAAAAAAAAAHAGADVVIGAEGGAAGAGAAPPAAQAAGDGGAGVAGGAPGDAGLRAAAFTIDEHLLRARWAGGSRRPPPPGGAGVLAGPRSCTGRGAGAPAGRVHHAVRLQAALRFGLRVAQPAHAAVSAARPTALARGCAASAARASAAWHWEPGGSDVPHADGDAPRHAGAIGRLIRRGEVQSVSPAGWAAAA